MTKIRQKFGAVKVTSPPGHHLPTLQRAAQCAEPLRLRHASGGSVGWRGWRWRSEMCYLHQKMDICWLLVTGTWLDYFPMYWEESSQLTNSYFSEGLKPPTSMCLCDDWFDLIWQIDRWMDGWMHRCLHNILLCVYIYYIDLCAYEVCTCNDSIGFSFALMCLSDQCAIDSSLAE